MKGAEPAASRPSGERAAALWAAGIALAMLGPGWARGLTVYWSDLTYLHHGWRAAPAMLVQAGRTPLWEPALYFGMPMAASMQGGLFYPPGALFQLFGFATATALFQLLHLVLAGWLAALWLRSWRVAWGPSLGGAALLALSGVMVARLPYLNHLSTLAWAPALALLFRRPAALAAVLALMVLAGYPLFIPGCAAAAWALALACRRSGSPVTDAARWAGAAAGAALLAAAQLLPGLELAANSRRSGGVPLDEALTWAFAPRDLLQWAGPALTPLSDVWCLVVYVGVAGAGAAALGAASLPRRRAAVLLALLAGVVVLTLGGTNPLSAALWRDFPPLRFVRYPGNLAYLALLPLAALAAAGMTARRLGPALALLVGLELAVAGWSATPMAPRRLFVEKGPLAAALQESLGAARYLLSPLALQASVGTDAFDWRQRLYGLSNAPVRLRAAANFGEPLVPGASYAAMDAVFRLPSAEAAAAWLPWLGASTLLAPAPVRSPLLVPEPPVLWQRARVKAPAALAWKLGEREGAALPSGWPAAPPRLGAPLAVSRPREDRFSVSGEGAGWVYAAEPRFPGWTTELNGEPIRPDPALGVFQKVAVPEGRWLLSWRYRPLSWRLGLLLSWLALAALAAGAHSRFLGPRKG